MAATEGLLREKFKPKDGPFLKSLDKALQDLNVERQKYQGGTFVGNDVHKMLKVRGTHTHSFHDNKPTCTCIVKEY